VRAELRQYLRGLGTTTLYATNDQAEAIVLADRVAVLDGGRLRQVGTPDDVYEQPADSVVARFVGSPPMNLVAVRVAEGMLRGPGPIVLPLPPGAVLADGEELLAGFRAEGAACPLALAGDGAFPALLDVVERAGHERLWQLSAGEQRLAVRPPRQARATPGEIVAVAVDRAAVRLFDAVTGLAR
jgi:multiple sugar transport system ATP-binding protein